MRPTEESVEPVWFNPSRFASLTVKPCKAEASECAEEAREATVEVPSPTKGGSRAAKAAAVRCDSEDGATVSLEFVSLLVDGSAAAK
jgi:hypothetical protein